MIIIFGVLNLENGENVVNARTRRREHADCGSSLVSDCVAFLNPPPFPHPFLRVIVDLIHPFFPSSVSLRHACLSPFGTHSALSSSDSLVEKMREVISIHVGQAGVQIGNACCESFFRNIVDRSPQKRDFDASYMSCAPCLWLFFLIDTSYFRGTLHR